MNTSETISALIAAQATLDRWAETAAIRAISQRRFRSGRQHSDAPLAQRIIEHVAWGATDCWHWIGSVNKQGYGRLTYEARLQSAHRLSYRAFNGPIPAGLLVRHRCDNTSCVNPEHLLLGTYSDNMHDAWGRGRNKGRTGQKGNFRGARQ